MIASRSRNKTVRVLYFDVVIGVHNVIVNDSLSMMKLVLRSMHLQSVAVVGSLRPSRNRKVADWLPATVRQIYEWKPHAEVRRKPVVILMTRMHYHFLQSVIFVIDTCKNF